MRPTTLVPAVAIGLALGVTTAGGPGARAQGAPPAPAPTAAAAPAAQPTPGAAPAPSAPTPESSPPEPAPPGPAPLESTPPESAPPEPAPPVPTPASAGPGAPAAEPMLQPPQGPRSAPNPFAEVPPARPRTGGSTAPGAHRVDVSADLQNLVLFRNDADFDRTAPLYDEDGQSVGVLATVFFPTTLWHVTDHLRLFYQAELGLNFWSAQNPDEQDATAPDVFLLKHRQVYAEGDDLADRFGFRVGYAHVQDPTGLFLNHWFGVGQVWTTWADHATAGLYFGQLPDATFEGILAIDNNFRHDVSVGGARARLELPKGFALDASLSGLYDSQFIDQTRAFAIPSARLSFARPGLRIDLDAVVQIGSVENAVDDDAATLFGYALQGHADLRLGQQFVLAVNALALSPDDKQLANDTDWAFRASGKSRSRTIILTEDEIRDWFDNIDERMASFESGFYVNRAGLLVGDAELDWMPRPEARIALVVGGATVLMPPNALDHTFVGLETDLLLEWRVADRLSLLAAAGLLLPGKAGAALVNQIDLTATDPIYMTEASLVVRY